MKIYSLTKYVYYIIATVLILGLGISLFFLYDNFYNTLAQARVVYILKSQVAFETIDMALWQKIIQNYQNKKTPYFMTGVLKIDPFAPLIEVKKKEE